jgi:hypothetical protein
MIGVKLMVVSILATPNPIIVIGDGQRRDSIRFGGGSQLRN